MPHSREEHHLFPMYCYPVYQNGRARFAVHLYAQNDTDLPYAYYDWEDAKIIRTEVGA